jgi:hypothetical protein
VKGRTLKKALKWVGVALAGLLGVVVVLLGAGGHGGVPLDACAAMCCPDKIS